MIRSVGPFDPHSLIPKVIRLMARRAVARGLMEGATPADLRARAVREAARAIEGVFTEPGRQETALRLVETEINVILESGRPE